MEQVTPIASERRCRSGAPPAAPRLSITFAQAASDPHSFRLCKRRVAAWQIRVAQWIPDEEVGLILLEALQGDSALLCQDIPFQRLYARDGVQHLCDLYKDMEQRCGHMNIFVEPHMNMSRPSMQDS